MGATLGKLLFGLRVVDVSGARPGLAKVALRTICRMADGLLFYLVAFVTALATGDRRQRVGDLAAGTFVVRRR